MTARIPLARAICLCTPLTPTAGPSSSLSLSLSTRCLSSSSIAIPATSQDSSEQRSHQKQQRRDAHLQRTQRQSARNIEKLITLYHSTSTFPTVAPRDSPAARALAEYVDGKLLEKDRKTAPLREDEMRAALEARRLAASGARAAGRAAPLMSLATGRVHGSEEDLHAEYPGAAAPGGSSRQRGQRVDGRNHYENEHDNDDHDDAIDGLSTEAEKRAQRRIDSSADFMDPERAGAGAAARAGAGAARRPTEHWRPFDELATQREVSRGKQVIDALVGTVQARYAGPQLVSRLWEVNESWWAEETGRKEGKETGTQA